LDFRTLRFSLRILVMALALPKVMQSGQKHFPARSKLSRIFGKFMHQHDRPSVDPQLNDVPHSSQVNFWMVP